MAVFRVKKNRNYTTMANYHLCDTNLSLKAIGLLSKMLSLSDKWDYTTRGLASICKEGVGAIGAALQELEQFGYLVRKQHRNQQGRITDTEYIIYEKPQITQPDTDNPDASEPHTENPYLDGPLTESSSQLNTNQSSTKESNTNQSTSPPTPWEMPSSWDPWCGDGEEEREIRSIPVLKGLNPTGPGGYLRVQEGVRGNVNYEAFRMDVQQGQKEVSITHLDMVVEVITETLCSQKKTIVISGETIPLKTIQAQLLTLDFTHVEYVLECLSQTPNQINHVKRYLLTLLYHAPFTMDGYYATMVQRHKYQT